MRPLLYTVIFGFCLVGALIAALAAAIVFYPIGQSEICDVVRHSKFSETDAPDLDGQTCVAVGPNSSEFICSFEFPFRSNDAKKLYADHVKDLQACYNFGEAADWREQKSVNHPDSYEQTVFKPYDAPEISVSLKDKGALQKTYVFVRFTAN